MFAEAPGSGRGPESRSAPLGDGLAELPLEHLEHEIETLAAHISAGSCRWLELVAEFDRRDGWWSWGVRSCAEWISWRCAIAPRAAREHVRVARRLCELPRIRDEFRLGRLSYSKVRALTRVADERSEAGLLELATHATAAQLERIVRGHRRVTREEANRAHERSYVNWSWDEDGSLYLRARLPAEDGAVLLRALEAARDSLAEKLPDDGEEESKSGSADPHSEGGSAEPPRPTYAEALSTVAETALAAGPGSALGGERYQTVVHVDAAVLSDPNGGANGGGQIDDGPAISAETARRIACDGPLHRDPGQGGDALANGPKDPRDPAGPAPGASVPRSLLSVPGL